VPGSWLQGKSKKYEGGLGLVFENQSKNL